MGFDPGEMYCKNEIKKIAKHRLLTKMNAYGKKRLINEKTNDRGCLKSMKWFSQRPQR
jgi:hypothetical protein